MTIAICSIIVLGVVVAMGFIKKVNLGFLAIGASVILGMLGGVSDKTILSGFSSSLFVTLAGVTFLFGIASINGTLELLSKKIVALIGKRTYLIPVIMFVLSAFLSAIGPGNVAVGMLMTTFGVYLSVEMKINPFATALIAKLGANAGGMSPLAPGGVVAANLAAAQGITDNGMHVFFTTLLSGAVFSTIIYFGFKCYKVRAENPIKWSELPGFERKQKLTLAIMAILVVVCIAFGQSVGLCSFIAAAVLILAGAVDEKKAIRNIPWGTLMMIVGVGMLINTISELGGIKMISDFLISLMNEHTAVPIMALTSGVLSWVSSTLGVVLPTLYPVASEISQALPGVQFAELTSAIVSTSFAAAISPLSVGGAIIISGYASATELSIDEQNKMFKKLFLISVGNVAVNVFMAAIGIFGF